MALETGAIEGRRFVTMRFKRIKTWSHVYHVRRHNTREMECRHLEAGARAPHLLIGGSDIAGRIRALLDQHGIKHRQGEVLALEFVVSTSREVFEDIDRDERQRRINDLISCAMRGFRDRFQFPGQIVSVALHRDERTPHLHIVVVPLICEPDNRRKDRAPTVRLSAKRVVGGRGDMAREQTRFASYFDDMGLQRGRERSGARHISNREHEALLEAARRDAVDEREALEEDRDRLAEEWDMIARDRAILEMEVVRLQADREAMIAATGEAAALKERALKRIKALDPVLALTQQLAAKIDAIEVNQRTEAMDDARRLAMETERARQAAVANDDYLKAALLYFATERSAGKGR